MKVIVVVGGQFGSEAKGHVAAQLAKRELERGQSVFGMRVAGHNAGHTAYDPLGRPFALRTIPVMAVVDDRVQLIIGPGSEVMPQVLVDEGERLESAGIPVWGRLNIDEQATVIEGDHIVLETGMHESMGSTGKGVGAARAERLMRRADTWGGYFEDNLFVAGHEGSYSLPGMDTVRFVRDQADRLDERMTLIIEGTQGYGLGLHAGFYPYCTSSDCRTIDFLGMAGIDPRANWIEDCETWMVCRTFPIRVAGNSGPLENEITWEHLAEKSAGHIKPEKTTVTQKVRRVGMWDQDLVLDAFEANGGERNVRIALTFADYIDPQIFGRSEYRDVEKSPFWAWAVNALGPLWPSVEMITTGPNTAVMW